MFLWNAYIDCNYTEMIIVICVKNQQFFIINPKYSNCRLAVSVPDAPGPLPDGPGSQTDGPEVGPDTPEAQPDVAGPPPL